MNKELVSIFSNECFPGSLAGHQGREAARGLPRSMSSVSSLKGGLSGVMMLIVRQMVNLSCECTVK